MAKRLAAAQAVAIGWMVLSVWLSLPWLLELSDAVGLVPAAVILSVTAWVPGWVVAYLAVRLALADPREPATIMIATRNDAATITDRLRHIARHADRDHLEVIVVDHGSDDGTTAIAEAAGAALGLDVRCIDEAAAGRDGIRTSLLDLALTAICVPALLLALTGRCWILAPYAIAVLPFTIFVKAIVHRRERELRPSPPCPARPYGRGVDTAAVDRAKVVRLASTALSLLEETSTRTYDDPASDRGALRHASAVWARLVVEVGSSLSDEALEELGRLIPRLPDDDITAGELRVIESQLVGWLGGIIAAEHLDEPDVAPVPDESS